MYMHKNYGTFRNMPIQIHMHANLLTNNFPPNMLYMLNTIQLHLVSTCISTTCTSYKLQRQVFALQVFLK